MKVLITRGYHFGEEQLKQIEALGCEVVVWPTEEEPVPPEHHDAEVLINYQMLKRMKLDVFDQEPLPKDHPLWRHPKILATPHNSFLSTSVKNRMFQLAFDNIEAYLEKEPLTNRQP